MKVNRQAQFIFLLLIAAGVGAVLFLTRPQTSDRILSPVAQSKFPSSAPTPTPTPPPKPSPSPSPLSFAQLNSLYGPCTRLPVLMYHHIQDDQVAQKGGYLKLNVSPTNFHSQMQYLKDKGYAVLTFKDVDNFFDAGMGMPQKAVVLTFDDGYEDFYTLAFPILREFNFPAALFLPTGLVNNPGYLNWGQIQEMANSGLVFFGNHTWSHRSMNAAASIVSSEITTADTQLANYGLNIPKVFAYPYGSIGKFALDELTKDSYTLAFSTIPGSILCKKQRLNLPRVRIGNTSLSYYGF